MSFFIGMELACQHVIFLLRQTPKELLQETFAGIYAVQMIFCIGMAHVLVSAIIHLRSYVSKIATSVTMHVQGINILLLMALAWTHVHQGASKIQNYTIVKLVKTLCALSVPSH